MGAALDLPSRLSRAAGYRVVHGGTRFVSPVVVTDQRSTRNQLTRTLRGMDGDREWASRRDHAVAAHAADRARREAAEAAQAAELLREFVTAARERGLVPVPLTAQSYSGRGRYRTRLRGWYLSSNQTMAVAENGHFYLLTVPGSLAARFTGVTVTPATPRLVLGEGGRDGERIPLRTLLDRLLQQ